MRNLLIGLLFLFSYSALKADEVTVDGIIYEINTYYKTASVLNCVKMDTVAIPSEFTYGQELYRVQSIEKKGFYNNSNIAVAKIPSTVVVIHSNAFQGCNSLKEIIFEDGSKDLECVYVYSTEIPFKDSNNIEKIYLGRNFNNYGLFQTFKSIVEVNVGDEVTKIPDAFFNECSNLSNLTIGESVEEIGSAAFAECVSLTNIVIPDNVKEIGGQTFKNCEGITNLTLGKNVNIIGGGAFSGCVGLTELFIPDGITEIGHYAFNGCNNLKEVIIGNGVIRMEDAFTDCSLLSSLQIGDNVGNMDNAFKGCINLESISIPNRVENMNGAFVGCEKLKEVIIEDGKELLYGTSSAFSGCPIEKVYIGRDIYNSPFKEMETIKDVTFGPYVTDMPFYMFQGCTGLKEITIPDNIEWIGKWAFMDCTNLETIIVGEGLKGISDCAFQNCIKLKEMPVGNNLRSIGSHSFQNCQSLSIVNLPDAVNDIGSYAFADCINITEFSFGAYTPLISSYAFFNCKSLKRIEFNYFDISPSTFEGCESLEEVVLGEKVDYVYSSAFKDCKSLKEIVFPYGIRGVSSYAFAGCLSLTDVKFEDISGSVNVSPNAFADSPIERLYLGQNVIFNSSPFRDNEALKEVTIGEKVTEIGTAAFEGCTSIEQVTSFAPNPPKITISTFDITTEKHATLLVPEGSLDIYKETPYWENFYNIREDNQAGIESAPIDNDINDDIIYSITGLKLPIKRASELRNYPRGVYIVNGEKRLVR